MTLNLNERQTRLLRLRSQRLLFSPEESFISPAQKLRAVCGVQGQDFPSALLSIRARSAGLTAGEIERARQEDRSIVWSWCQRGTLHLLATSDLGWVVPLLGPIFIASNRRRWLELGWDDDRTAAGLRLLQAELAANGNLTRAEVSHLLDVNGLPYQGQATIHLLFRAALEGILCIGPFRGKEQTYVLTEAWIGRLNPLPRPEALAMLADRYLRAYGPASAKDLASWSGLKIGDARQACQLIADNLIQVEAAGRPAWIFESRLVWLEEWADMPPNVRLLPRYDTYLLGYTDRDLVVEPAYTRRIHPGGGQISAAVLVDGQALGTWSTRRRAKALEIIISPFEQLPEELLPLIEAEVADIGRFLGVKTVCLFE